MSDNIISDDLPIATPLGDAQIYVVRLSVYANNGIERYDVALKARSLRDAAEEAGKWCRRMFQSPARDILSIQSPEAHAVQMRQATGETVDDTDNEPYTDVEIAEVLRRQHLRDMGAGAYMRLAE
jgi:uncharacterized protein (DUF2252 family)